MKDWNGHCHRCGAKTSIHIMSMFNTDLICMTCKDKEKRRADYKAAEEADLAAYRLRMKKARGEA